MATNGFDTVHKRECMDCHRATFDGDDWLFIGYDDEAELYICPDCQWDREYVKDDLLVRQPEQSNDAETGIPAAICASCVHFKKECRGIQNGCPDWEPLS